MVLFLHDLSGKVCVISGIIFANKSTALDSHTRALGEIKESHDTINSTLDGIKSTEAPAAPGYVILAWKFLPN